jgi:hypothetical protein
MRHLGLYALPALYAGPLATRPGRKDSTRPIGLSCCTDCPLSRLFVGADPCGFHVSLELFQLRQWLANNPGLKDQALADAVLKEPWDPRLLFQGSERAGPRRPARGNELRGGRGDDRGLRLGGRAGRVRCYRHQDIHG